MSGAVGLAVFAANAIVVAVEPVDITADDTHGAGDVSWAIAAAASAIHIAGDWDAGTGVIGVAFVGFCGCCGEGEGGGE